MDQVVQAVPRHTLEALQAKNAEAERRASIEPPRFVDEDRSYTLPLSFPVTYDGKVYDSITVTRPTIRQWRKYMGEVAEAIRANGQDAGDLVDPPYLNVPAIVYNNLDFADGTMIDAAVDGFFGRSPSSEEESGDQDNASESSSGEQSPSS